MDRDLPETDATRPHGRLNPRATRQDGQWSGHGPLHCPSSCESYFLYWYGLKSTSDSGISGNCPAIQSSPTSFSR